MGAQRWVYVHDSNFEYDYLDGDSHAPVGAEYLLAAGWTGTYTDDTKRGK